MTRLASACERCSPMSNHAPTVGSHHSTVIRSTCSLLVMRMSCSSRVSDRGARLAAGCLCLPDERLVEVALERAAVLAAIGLLVVLRRDHLEVLVVLEVVDVIADRLVLLAAAL